ncbi:MAG: SPOR domain-containing protein [Bacteroidaceae bacterium]|nr:SPOR domain-containing protein [Bacteroidaceae bacterium]
MKRLLFFTLTILLCTITMSAQTFTEHLTSKVAGQGIVTVHQDSRLNDIVNGKKQLVIEKKEKDDGPGIQTGKKVRARGYRIQVFWGGSETKDKSNARRAGAKVTNVFPELEAYIDFESPNWRCRIGDFATYEEASEYLKKIKEARLVSEPNIVKSEVLVYPNSKK